MKASRSKTICIVTPYGTFNYGTNLQAMGLSKTLETIGFNVFFLEKFRVVPFSLKHPMLLFARINRVWNKKKATAYFTPVKYDIAQERKQRMATFRAENFKSIAFDTSEKWNNAIEEDMIFCAGSDILWNPARGYPATEFLDFAYYANLKRLSYASSVGALELPKFYYSAYKRYLGSMCAVGVREESVAKMFDPIIGKKPVKVLDPSLLLEKSDWEKFAENAKISIETEDKYILCYFVMNDPRYWEYVDKIRQYTKTQIVVLPMHQIDEKQPYDIINDGTPYEFVWLIKNAWFVCTDSFHACAVSTIFNKDFYLLKRDREAENAKYEDFLSRYKLKDRFVDDESSFTEKPTTSFEYANSKIVEDRAQSLEFLRNALM